MALVSTTVHYGVILALGSALLAEMDVTSVPAALVPTVHYGVTIAFGSALLAEMDVKRRRIFSTFVFATCCPHSGSQQLDIRSRFRASPPGQAFLERTKQANPNERTGERSLLWGSVSLHNLGLLFHPSFYYSYFVLLCPARSQAVKFTPTWLVLPVASLDVPSAWLWFRPQNIVL